MDDAADPAKDDVQARARFHLDVAVRHEVVQLDLADRVAEGCTAVGYEYSYPIL